jgi:hypothetical protein
MDALGALLANGRIADIVLAVMIAEAVALLLASRFGRIGMSCSQVAAALLPGFFIVLALRAALVQANWSWIALALLGALVAHLVDMRQRLRSPLPTTSAHP